MVDLRLQNGLIVVNKLCQSIPRVIFSALILVDALIKDQLDPLTREEFVGPVLLDGVSQDIVVDLHALMKPKVVLFEAAWTPEKVIREVDDVSKNFKKSKALYH